MAKGLQRGRAFTLYSPALWIRHPRAHGSVGHCHRGARAQLNQLLVAVQVPVAVIITADAEMQVHAMTDPLDVIHLPLAVLLTLRLKASTSTPRGRRRSRAVSSSTVMPLSVPRRTRSASGSTSQGACTFLTSGFSPPGPLPGVEHLFDPAVMVASGPDPARKLIRDQLAARLQEPSLASERLLPVDEGLAELLPGRGLRRGSVTAVGRSHALALALVAEASRTSWVAAVGLDNLGILAAHELGLALERLALIPSPGRRWADVTAVMIEAVDVVMVRPPAGAPAATLRRLAARGRERGQGLGKVRACLVGDGRVSEPGAGGRHGSPRSCRYPSP